MKRIKNKVILKTPLLHLLKPFDLGGLNKQFQSNIINDFLEEWSMSKNKEELLFKKICTDLEQQLFRTKNDEDAQFNIKEKIKYLFLYDAQFLHIDDKLSILKSKPTLEELFGPLDFEKINANNTIINHIFKLNGFNSIFHYMKRKVLEEYKSDKSDKSVDKEKRKERLIIENFVYLLSFVILYDKIRYDDDNKFPIKTKSSLEAKEHLNKKEKSALVREIEREISILQLSIDLENSRLEKLNQASEQKEELSSEQKEELAKITSKKEKLKEQKTKEENKLNSLSVSLSEKEVVLNNELNEKIMMDTDKVHKNDNLNKLFYSYQVLKTNFKLASDKALPYLKEYEFFKSTPFHALSREQKAMYKKEIDEYNLFDDLKSNSDGDQWDEYRKRMCDTKLTEYETVKLDVIHEYKNEFKNEYGLLEEIDMIEINGILRLFCNKDKLGVDPIQYRWINRLFLEEPTMIPKLKKLIAKKN